MTGKKLPKSAFLAMTLLGMAGALAALVCLTTLDFKLFDLVYYVPALGISALLLLVGGARLKRK